MAATERTPLVGGAERARFSPQRAAAGLIVCACALAAVQLGSHLSSNANLLTTELTEQSGQGFFSALMTSGSFMMMQAGAFAETLGSQAASAAAPAAPAREAQPECAEACETCDIPAVVAACDKVVPQPHDTASEQKDLQLAATCAERFGCSGCLSCHEQHNGFGIAAQTQTSHMLRAVSEGE